MPPEILVALLFFRVADSGAQVPEWGTNEGSSEERQGTPRGRSIYESSCGSQRAEQITNKTPGCLVQAAGGYIFTGTECFDSGFTTAGTDDTECKGSREGKPGRY